MKNKLKKILKIFLILVIFSIIYIITFHLSIRKLIPVYTYYGMISLLFVTILLIIVLFIIYKKTEKFLDYKDCIIIVLLFFSLHIYVFCMVPVTLERSISVFMLNELDENKKYKKEEIEEIFINKYVYKYDAFEKRLKEQEYTGSIVEKNNKYTLSNKGKLMLNCFRFIKKIYKIEGKILN